MLIDSDDYYLIPQRGQLLDFLAGEPLGEHRGHRHRDAV